MNAPRLVLLGPQGDATTVALDAAPGADVLAIPGEAAHVAWLPMPARTDAQARAAARALLGERLATPIDGLHVAVARPSTPDDGWLVVAVARDAMDAWVRQGAELGLAGPIVPDCLLLPPPSDDAAAVTLARGDRVLVRGTRQAFTAESALADTVLAGQARHVLPPDTAESVLAGGAGRVPIDLRQEAYAPNGHHGGTRIPRWRLLAALVLVSPLLVLAAEAARYAWSAARLDARTLARAAQAPGVGAGAPVQAVSAARAALAAGDPFAHQFSALAGAIAATPGTRLVSATFERGTGLSAVVQHGDPADIATLDGALHATGLAVGVDESVAAAGGIRTTLRVEATR